MIINRDSILYNLPGQLLRKDLFILDSLRFTLELIDQNYSLFIKELNNLSVNHGIKNNEYRKNLIPVFNYCWSIIDNSQRFIKLYKLLPSKNNHALIKEISKITPLRNTFQHMDERIDECLLEYDVPFYGALSWEVNLGVKDTMHKFFAISGLFLPSIDKDYRVEKKNIPKNEIQKITLQTFIRKGTKSNYEFVKKEIDISEFYLDLKNVVKEFESNLETQFKNQNAILVDWIKRRDIVLRFDL